MHSSSFVLAALPFLAVAVQAAAPPSCTNNGIFERKVYACPTKTAFCKSYIHTKGGTRTVTAAAVTVTATSVITTIPTSEHTTVATSKVVVTSPTTTTTTIAATCSPLLDVRDGAPEEYKAPYDSDSSSSSSFYKEKLKERGVLNVPPVGPSCGVGTAPRMSISRVCSCVLYQTTTTTPTVTAAQTKTVFTTEPVVDVTTTEATVVTSTTEPVTVQTTLGAPPQCLPDISCGNSGLMFRHYTVPSQYYNTNQDPGVFNPNNFASFEPSLDFGDITPDGQQVVNQIAGIYNRYGGQTGMIHGHTYGFNYGILDYTGFIFAPVSGTYTVYNDAADNYGACWVGSNAYSAKNAGAVLVGNFQTSQTVGTFFLGQGTYTPIRLVMGAGFQPNSLAMKITAPDGTVILESQQGPTSYFVYEVCGGASSF